MKPMSSETPVGILPPFIKLDQFLKLAGHCSTGGEAKALILEGLVTVGGEVCRERGRKLRGGEQVVVDDACYTVVLKP